MARPDKINNNTNAILN